MPDDPATRPRDTSRRDENVPDAADEPRALSEGHERKDKVLQNTEHGYVETDVDDIPLSEKTGEARKEG